VAPDNSNQVYATHSVGDDTVWAAPYVLPTSAAAAHYDDISAIVAFQGDKIGVMWSNQLTRKFYMAVHRDGTPDGSWQTEVAYGGGVGGCSTGCANDHVNLKQLSTDGTGRVFAAIKTANRNTGQPFVVLLARDRAGAWSSYPFGAVEDLHTRPMIMVDAQHRELFMFAVSPEVGGTIYYKKTSTDNISFAPGVGTPFIQNTQDSDISNPTSTKQNLDSTTGLVVLASANTHAVYYHNYMSLAGEPTPPPPAPTDLAATSPLTNADSTMRLAWSNNESGQSEVAIERRSGSGSYSEIARVAGDATSYTDSGLAAGTTYTYRVRASNSAGFSPYSAEASGTTAEQGPVRTFTPVADAYVDSGTPTKSYGTVATLGVDASPVQESYLKFNLTGLTGNTVNSAKLRIYVTDNGSVKGGSVAKVSSSSWTEGVTYNTRPTIDGATLSSLGAVNVGTWYEFDVSGAVTSDGTVSLGIKSSSSDGVHYAAREDAAHAPQLVVNVSAGDSTPPDTTITSGPSGSTASAAASFAFAASEPGSSFECSIDGAAFAACTSAQGYAGLAEGQHTFQVRAIDASGNIDPTPAVRTWTVDTVPPGAVISSAPASVTNSDTASFEFSADEPNVTFTCSLDGAPATSCSSPAHYAGLADGDHTFVVMAADAAGNVGASDTRTWTIDTVSPDTTITTGPQGVATSGAATFTFSSSEPGSTYECALDGAAYGPCASPTSYTGLSDGGHTLYVRAIDAAGNVDATPANRTWTVDTGTTDTTPPTVTVTAPSGVQPVSGTLTLSADAADDMAIDHVDFLVDGSLVGTDGTAPYSVSWDSTTAADGPITITARAVDTSGNETTSDGRGVTVDNTAPDTSIDSGPQGATASSSATFAFSTNDAGASLRCSLDGAAYASCTSPQSFSGLAEGPHTFAVQAVDKAGNVDASPATRTWTVDTVAPETTITAGPAGVVHSRSASLSFSSNEPSATFECSLDNSAWTTCTSPRTLTGLADGSHTILVRAIDGAGNVDPTSARWTWTVDPVAFADGFESGGYSAWSAPHTAINGTATVQSGVLPADGGGYAASISAPDADSYAYVRKTLGVTQPDLTVSGEFDVTAEGPTSQEVSIFKLYDPSGVRLVYLNRRNISGSLYVNYGGTNHYTPAKLSLGAWATFKVHVVAAGSGTSTVEVFMNGVSIYNSTTASLGTTGIRTIEIGNDKQLPFSLFADNIEARL
jgi:Bacterial Ig domain/Fibronectin type III domain